ncbi:hypothetical protein Tco_1330396 [Tanacetum coccineum]
MENPPSSSGTLSSMKNLDDAFTFGDQFLNDKPTEEELGKANMETKVESMVTIPIHQATSSAPLLSTPIINLTPLKPVSSPAQEPVFTAITTITTPLLPLLPPQQQGTTDSELATLVSTLEKIYRDNQKKMMRETEVHKFSDGTLTRILEKLDHMVKDYVLFKFNPGMDHKIWSEDDKRRSK